MGKKYVESRNGVSKNSLKILKILDADNGKFRVLECHVLQYSLKFRILLLIAALWMYEYTSHKY